MLCKCFEYSLHVSSCCYVCITLKSLNHSWCCFLSFTYTWNMSCYNALISYSWIDEYCQLHNWLQNYRYQRYIHIYFTSHSITHHYLYPTQTVSYSKCRTLFYFFIMILSICVCMCFVFLLCFLLLLILFFIIIFFIFFFLGGGGWYRYQPVCLSVHIYRKRNTS